MGYSCVIYWLLRCDYNIYVAVNGSSFQLILALCKCLHRRECGKLLISATVLACSFAS